MSVPGTAIDQGDPQGPPVDGAPEPGENEEILPQPTEEDPEERRRRRRILLLFLLGALVFLFGLIGGWYLINRKPITEILPPIVQDSLPKYSFSIYGTIKPMGIAVSPSGDRIYVAETEGQHTVHVYDGKGDPLTTFSPPGSILQSRLPTYIAVEPTTGDVYVSDRQAKTIYVFDKDGQYRRTFEPKLAIADFQPLGLVFDGQGDLYVGDVGTPFHRIHEFRADGALVRTIGAADQFLFPNGLAVDSLGNLLVADGNHGRVVQVDATGRQLGGISSGVGAGQLGLPRGLTTDDKRRLYVVDATGQGVGVYGLDQQKPPSFIGFFGAEGTGDGQFEYPTGVAADAHGRIYVADWANDRVQVWSY